jgi:protein-ribulosamine 3-kinase
MPVFMKCRISLYEKPVMSAKPFLQYLEQYIAEKTGGHCSIRSMREIHGGCINQAYALETSCGPYFMKTNKAGAFPGMFEKEALGLKTLSETGEVSTPGIGGCAAHGNTAFLLLEYIEQSEPTEDFWIDFGRSLAALHRHTAEQFGFESSNFIGSLPQSNRQHKNWVSFFAEERLEPVVKMALDLHTIDAAVARKFSALYNILEQIFPQEPPALLHGDLWNGNFLVSSTGKPCLIDPAVYYGSREMDIGMTRLFGGFHSLFYQAYNETYPLEPEWEERSDICNLYPLMVHVVLFGGGYLQQVKGIISRYV